MEYAEVAAESEGAKYVWIEADGSFGYAIDPDDVPENVQSVPLDQTLAVGAAVEKRNAFLSIYFAGEKSHRPSVALDGEQK